MRCVVLGVTARASDQQAPGLPSPDVLEATLRDLVAALPRERVHPKPGRPPVLPALQLWCGLLVCILRRYETHAELWRLLCDYGFWDFPLVAIGRHAVYQRERRAAPTTLLPFFAGITRVLRESWPETDTLPTLRCATGVFALDRTKLDPVARRLKLLRGVPPGAPCLLPGSLNCVFDVRRQLWHQLDFSAEAQQNEKKEARALLAALPAGSLLLFDLGYFSFPWLDELTQRGFHFVCRIPEKVTYEVQALLYAGGDAGATLREEWVYLGKYRADRAASPLRLITLTVGQRTFRYLTNVLDPRHLSAAQVADLYQRRWNIEQAFALVKNHLGVELLWSAEQTLLVHQVLAAFTLSQLILALRGRVAAEAQVAPREVSVALLIRCLPRMARPGRDPLAAFIQHGRRLGFIRPFRGRVPVVPCPDAGAYQIPEHPPPERTPRYAGKQGRTERSPRFAEYRQRYPPLRLTVKE